MDYEIGDSKEVISKSDLTNIFAAIYYKLPAEDQEQFDIDAQKILNSFDFLLKRLSRSDSERFNN